MIPAAQGMGMSQRLRAVAAETDAVSGPENSAGNAPKHETRSGIVHVVDDDAPLRDSLEFLLSAAGFEVKVFTSAEAFLEILPQAEGCILTDIRMAGIDGIELLNRVQTGAHKLPVIVMTGQGDIPLAVKAMKLGAADFLEKPFQDSHLISAIDTALASCAPQEAVVDEGLAARLQSLSQRERQVLAGLVEGKTNKEIARHFDLSPRTVEVYRAKLMTKMQAASVSDLVRMAIRAGAASL